MNEDFNFILLTIDWLFTNDVCVLRKQKTLSWFIKFIKPDIFKVFHLHDYY